LRYAAAEQAVQARGGDVHPVVIDRTIPYGDLQLLVAHDAEQRRFVGLKTGPAQRGDFVFMQVAPHTVDEIAAQVVPLFTVIDEHRTGLVFRAERQQVLLAMRRGRCTRRGGFTDTAGLAIACARSWPSSPATPLTSPRATR
jgi:hypothetical protein